MSGEQLDSPATRIKRVSEVLHADTESIYMEGYVTPEIWDKLTEDSILGRIAPNVAVGRAIIAQIQQLEDDLLSSIILAHIQSYKPKDKTYSSGAVRAWMNILRDELQTKSPGSILKKDETDQTTGAREPTVSVMSKAKIDFKLKSYDGTTNECSVWFWELEKSMKKLRISKEEYILHAINASSDKACTTICLLDDEFESDYCQIKQAMISIFDTKTRQDIQREFNRAFKHSNTETVTDFYIRFKQKTSELLAKGIWDEDQLNPNFLIQQFCSKLRVDLDVKISEYMEDRDLQEDGMTLENFFQLASRVDLRMSKENSKSVSTPIVPETVKRLKCHYCEQLGHVVRKCPSKRKGIKPCQTYIESGIRCFGPDYKWDTRKTNDAKLAHAVTAQEEEEGKVHAVAAVSEQLQTPLSVRCVALIKADYLDNGGNWHNNITTLADTCGCENGVNSLFAITNDFRIHNCDEFNEETSAIPATGGAVHFKQYIVVHMQIQDRMVETRFYLMDNLPRTFLIGYPWMMKHGGIVDARKGIFSIQDFNLIVPLLKNGR